MKIYVVGLGPGRFDEITDRAKSALSNSDVIIGYTVYTDLVKEYFKDAKILSTPMKREVERCHIAFREALKQKTVSMVCSGDAGVYGMAGLIYEVSKDYEEVEIEIISGITAACSGAAVLGAPLIHDFAVISLSDLLTPLETIHRRIDAAASADFAICIYNPSSKKRASYLHDAVKIILKHKSPETICGIVRNIGREGEQKKVLTLQELLNESVDMFTTVFIGNQSTEVISGNMVTKRGYKHD
ncbi:MAG: precorrin-3B C(17)-methyltransferase [Clostridium sp.]|uniref:precorrin-3B C(17)-methyltransferase n=1 Tax=Clostridium sp. TaxID=1506 RepID=UPI002FCB36F1